MANVAQAQHWNGDEGRHWADHQEHYEAMLGPLGARVIDAAAIQSGDRVLDVGCGAGDLSLCAARLVGGRGTVVGIDVSVPLVEAARRRAAMVGLDNVEFVVGDAQTHDFGAAAFDVAVSRLGVMFFDDSVAAFANIAGAVGPGGRLAFVCWQDAGANEWMLVPSIAALAHVPPPDPAVFDALNPFELADPDRVTAVLQEAGFSETNLTAIDEPLLFGGGGTLEEAVAFFRHGSFGQTLLAGADPDEAGAALAAVTEAFRTHLTSRGVELGAGAWLVTAQRTATCAIQRLV